jgi:ribosome-binding protein aMBF1 (putative translation factor)
MNGAADTVTLTRAEYDALVERAEEAEDLAAVAAAEAREVALGKKAARADHLPIELVRRLAAGEHPIAIWRLHRGLSRETLSAAAGLSVSRIGDIEERRQTGSIGALAKLAAALRVSLDELAPWLEQESEG